MHVNASIYTFCWTQASGDKQSIGHCQWSEYARFDRHQPCAQLLNKSTGEKRVAARYVLAPATQAEPASRVISLTEAEIL